MRVATQIARAIGIFDRNLGLANPSETFDGMGLGQRNSTGFNRSRMLCWCEVLIELIEEFVSPRKIRIAPMRDIPK